jgi:D-glycero-alpha-D-manno-heptose-7-phosphate kinase
MRRTDLSATYRATAPVRLDFAGGWTDVPPFSTRAGGVVVNAAIALQVEATLELGGQIVRLVSEDLEETVECADSKGLVLDGKLNLLKAGLRMFPVQGPLTLRTRAQVPPGSGLGSSGALDVALVACLAAARQDRLDARELAQQAWLLETREAGIPGGRQDQLAAALGGFNRLTFRDPDVGIEPITIDAAFADALERQIVLCYTGRSRVSGHTIARVMSAYERGDSGVVGALEAMKDITLAMAEALRSSDLGRVGALLSENWKRQQALDPGMQTEEMAALERAMGEAQVLGGKAAGSGAGGSMFFLAKASSRPALEAARRVGVTVLPFRWAWEGGRAW